MIYKIYKRLQILRNQINIVLDRHFLILQYIWYSNCFSVFFYARIIKLPTAALHPLDISSVRLGDWKRTHTKYMLKRCKHTNTQTQTHTHTQKQMDILTQTSVINMHSKSPYELKTNHFKNKVYIFSLSSFQPFCLFVFNNRLLSRRKQW